MTIHSAACSWCNDGRGKNKQAEHIDNGWYGFYTSWGAAFDAARSMGKVKKATCCPMVGFAPGVLAG